MNPYKPRFIIKKRTIAKRYVTVGYRIWNHRRTGRFTRIPVGKFGVGIIEALSGTGKSATVKIMIADVSETNRPILIIDPHGEYARSIWPNFMADMSIGGFRDFKTVLKPVFKISDLQAADWRTLGFSRTSAKVLEIIGRKVELHGNDFQRFEQIIMEIPTDKREAKGFIDKYGPNLVYVLHLMTEGQLKTNIGWFSKFFFMDDGTGRDKKGRFYCSNYAVLLAKGNLIINYNIDKNLDDYGMMAATVGTGIILRQLRPWFSRLKPLLVVDEADELAPAPQIVKDVSEDANDKITSTALALIEMCLKLRKRSVAMILIIQDPRRLHPTILGAWHWKILGTLHPGIPDYKLVRELKNEQVDNVDSSAKAHREFIYLKGSGRYEIFEPIVAPCEV